MPAISGNLRQTLHLRNVALRCDCEKMGSLLLQAAIPPLLEPYRQKMVRLCAIALNEAEGNLQLLRRNNDTLLEDVLSKTRIAENNLRLLSSLLATPVLRSNGDKDKLCLKCLHWMHQTHPATNGLPFAFTDGDVAIDPFIEFAPIYFFPALEQCGLLYQALHFHEFGHALYRLHNPELDDLIKEIQQVVGRELVPLSERGDLTSSTLAEKREMVVQRWFYWAQELFCDAVGLTLGGPAYLYAFSSYCGSLSVGDFTLSQTDMERSKHPTHALRIQFLVRRARELGFTIAAHGVEAEWAMLASELQVVLDFHGFYEESMEDEIYGLLSDMLTEANPRVILPEEVTADRDPISEDSPAFLVNRAWQVYHRQPEDYSIWEKSIVVNYAN